MISLKAGRFRISHDGDNYHVFTTEDGKNYQEITDALTVKDKEELIDDLIYCIQDSVRDK